jgi:hypothetical protein
MNFESLQELQNLPLDCVFGIISDSTKECYISHTKNLKTRIGAVLDSVYLQRDSRLIIFCTMQDDKYKRIYAQYYLDKYINDGYKNIGCGRKYINYKVRVQYSADLKYVQVVLINERKDKEIVGQFRSIEAANNFVDMYYRGDLVLPVYSI